MSGPGSWRRLAGVLTGVVVAGTLTACAGTSPTASTPANSASSVPVTTPEPGPTTGATGATTSTVFTSTPSTAPGAPASLAFPDPVLHPGAVNANLDGPTLCAPGFSTKSIRPPVSYTNRIKLLELGSGGTITGPSGTTYTVVGEHLPGVVSDYEMDHLISLEVAGNPEDPKNLWMEPWERKGARLVPPGQGAESKDVVEGRLHREICSGAITLADAQRGEAANWQTVK